VITLRVYCSGLVELLYCEFNCITCCHSCILFRHFFASLSD